MLVVGWITRALRPLVLRRLPKSRSAKCRTSVFWEFAQMCLFLSYNCFIWSPLHTHIVWSWRTSYMYANEPWLPQQQRPPLMDATNRRRVRVSRPPDDAAVSRQPGQGAQGGGRSCRQGGDGRPAGCAPLTAGGRPGPASSAAAETGDREADSRRRRRGRGAGGDAEQGAEQVVHGPVRQQRRWGVGRGWGVKGCGGHREWGVQGRGLGRGGGGGGGGGGEGDRRHRWWGVFVLFC